MRIRVKEDVSGEEYGAKGWVIPTGRSFQVRGAHYMSFTQFFWRRDWKTYCKWNILSLLVP